MYKRADGQSFIDYVREEVEEQDEKEGGGGLEDHPSPAGRRKRPESLWFLE